MRSDELFMVPVKSPDDVASRPDSKDEDLAYLVGIRNGLTERQRLALDNGNFVECDVCEAKAGAPTLCASCLANRYIIGMLTPSQRRRLVKKCAHVALLAAGNGELQTSILAPTARSEKGGGAVVGGVDPCVCGHAPEEHGHDSDHPSSTHCTECDCIAYESDPGET
jgi:hypothetical protein